MNYSKIEFVKKCDNVLFENLQLIYNDFASELDTKIVIDSEKLSWIEVIFINGKKNRGIQVLISEGMNADNKQSYNIRLNIQKIDDDREIISSFSIEDFCLEMNYPISVKFFFVDITNFLEELKSFFNIVNEIFQKEKLTRILFLDDWIDIKPNFIPYR